MTATVGCVHILARFSYRCPLLKMLSAQMLAHASFLPKGTCDQPILAGQRM